jgi:hypothetical protein
MKNFRLSTSACPCNVTWNVAVSVWNMASGNPRNGGPSEQNVFATSSSLGVRLSAIGPPTLHAHTALIYQARHIMSVRIWTLRLVLSVYPCSLPDKVKRNCLVWGWFLFPIFCLLKVQYNFHLSSLPSACFISKGKAITKFDARPSGRAV